ncbi:MAG: flavin reductase family protein [Actinomycetota bacterium]|nr:flavin reductase family protein [Actinomycetota bacterium]
MRNFATGVCIATTYTNGPQGRQHDAVTVNSLTSVSLDPPLVSICLHRDSTFLADLLSTKVWAVSILDVGAADLARCFARDKASREAAVCTLSATPGERTGALVLDAPSWMECRLRQYIEVGDHVMAIGEVLATGTQDRRPPLVFLHGKFHAVEKARPINLAGLNRPGIPARTNGEV